MHLLISILIFSLFRADASFDIISTTCVDGAVFYYMKILQGIRSTVSEVPLQKYRYIWDIFRHVGH